MGISIRRAFQADRIAVEGFDDTGFLSERARVRIGRHADADVRVTAPGGRSVLGGAASYVIEASHPHGWHIVHTGHIGTMSVDGIEHRKGRADVRDGSRIELFDCDTRDLALAFTIEIADPIP